MPKTKSKNNATVLKPHNQNKFVAFLSDNRYILLAFFIPFLLMVIAFGLMKVSPVGFIGNIAHNIASLFSDKMTKEAVTMGDKQILVTDLWHQYYPFLVDFQDKLKNGESLFWSWTQGGGVNYFALMSYYLASPLNFLSVFVPVDFLREFLMFSVSIKIALGGMFMAIFLRSVYKKNDMSLVIFGCCFSFCAFFMGYYWNTIWLDTVCLTPLVALGAVKLLSEGKFKLYTITLAVSLLANYYIGFFTCIFMLLIFIAYNIIKWKGIKEFAFNLTKMGAFSLMAIGLTAFFLLPAFFGLQNTNATGSNFPADFAINMGGTNDLLGVLKALRHIMANLVNFTAAANKEADAIPNIAICAVGLFFSLLYFTVKDVKFKEKAVDFCLILFMFLSCIIRQLDYIWHGFHFTNMIPYRFTYLISFLMVVMAFRAFMYIKKTTALHVIIATLLSAFVVSLSIKDTGLDIMFKDHMNWLKPTIFVTAILLAVTALTVLLYTRRLITHKVLSIVLVILVIGQSTAIAFFGVKRTTVTGTYDYPRGEQVTADVVEYMHSLEQQTPEMWRAEMTSTQTLNDSSLNGFNGLSMFNSMANVDMTRFFENFGMMGWKSGNRYTYAEGSPVTNMFMNLKYLIARDGYCQNTYDMTQAYTAGNVRLLKNEHYVPMGFMVNSDLLKWVENDNEDQFNPFDTQGEFFKLATGIEEPVYTPLETVSQGHFESDKFVVNKTEYGNYSFSCLDSTLTPSVKWNYEAPDDGLYLMYADIAGGDDVTVMVNDVAQPKTYGMGRSYIACIGQYAKGDKISVFAQLKQGQSGTAKVYVNKLNEDVFEQGYEIIKKDVMNTTKLTGNSMEGEITVSNAGLFYTSVPYEEGWTAKVDGKDVQITPVGGSLVAFELSEGTHTIELKYYPKGFWIGFAATSICALAFIFLCVYTFMLDKRKKNVKTVSVEAIEDTNENEQELINKDME